MLYSHNGSYPQMLPNRIRLSDGTTRTDKSTFTPEEIADAGYVAVDNPPSVVYPNKLEWTEAQWVVRGPHEAETAARWQYIKNACQQMLDSTDYKVIKAIESGNTLDANITRYRQELRDLYNNVNDVDPWTVQFPSLNVLDESEEII